MFLDFLNQTREKTLEATNTISNSIKDFISELQDYFNKPTINPALSKDNYWIDRIVKDYAVLINARTREHFWVPKNEMPIEVFEKEYWFIKVDNHKYVIDYESMFEHRIQNEEAAKQENSCNCNNP